MKKIIIFILISTYANAYTIGGSCKWGKYGYKYGNIGTYKMNGKIYQIFFGNNYCEY